MAVAVHASLSVYLHIFSNLSKRFMHRSKNILQLKSQFIKLFTVVLIICSFIHFPFTVRWTIIQLHEFQWTIIQLPELQL